MLRMESLRGISEVFFEVRREISIKRIILGDRLDRFTSPATEQNSSLVA